MYYIEMFYGILLYELYDLKGYASSNLRSSSAHACMHFILEKKLSNTVLKVYTWSDSSYTNDYIIILVDKSAGIIIVQC